MSKKLKGNLIILIAGATGGHMYPAIAVLEEIKKKAAFILLLIKEATIT